MKLKIPPVLIVGFTAFIMWLTAEYLRFEMLDFFVPNWIIIFTAISGVVCIVLGIVQFSVKKTTTNPHKPESSTFLVSSGIYRISRNPMYLGMLILLIFFGLYLGNGLVFLILPLFIWFMNTFQIKPEEQILVQKFGQEYSEYRKNVRRWI